MNLVVLELTKEGLKKQFGKNSKRKLKKKQINSGVRRWREVPRTASKSGELGGGYPAHRVTATSLQN